MSDEVFPFDIDMVAVDVCVCVFSVVSRNKSPPTLQTLFYRVFLTQLNAQLLFSKQHVTCSIKPQLYTLEISTESSFTELNESIWQLPR